MGNNGLVFNCTKAASEFFSVTRKGLKLSNIEPAPDKTIAESVNDPVINNTINNNFQWQWVVHCVSVKRKKYFMVMDYHSRFCLTFLAGKKGDQYQFLNDFKCFLRSTVKCIANESGMSELDAEICVNNCEQNLNSLAFHNRSDASVLAHLNDIQWRLKRVCCENGMLVEDVDLLGFNLLMSQYLRKTKNKKDYFSPGDCFLHLCLNELGASIDIEKTQTLEYSERKDNVVMLSDYRN